MYVVIKKLPFFLVSVPLSVSLVFMLSVLLKCGSSIPAVSSETPDEYALFLKEHGWNTSPDPFEVVYTTFPETPSDVFLKYNEVQKEQGFDLIPYMGKCVEKRVYEVYGYPGEEKDETIRADVYVYSGKIIGADICSVRMDGFLHGVIINGHGKNQNG